MTEIRFNPVGDKEIEMLYSKPCIIELHDKYLSVKSEFGFSQKVYDGVLPTIDISINEKANFIKNFITSVEYGYSSEGEAWFFQFCHLGGENQFWNVESQKEAVEIVDKILNWLVDK